MRSMCAWREGVSLNSWFFWEGVGVCRSGSCGLNTYVCAHDVREVAMARWRASVLRARVIDQKSE